MRNNFTIVLIVILSLYKTCLLWGQSKENQYETNYFKIQNYELENGTLLDEASLFYATIGQLDKDKSNVILLQTAFMGNVRQYDYLIGKGLALDPDKYFIIITELFAGGTSSSPTNTLPPFDGPRFPDFSIRDNINASHQLLKQQFNIGHLKAVIGFSMGAQQAFQWAVSYPDFMDLIVPICGTAKTYPHGVVRLESVNNIIKADSGFRKGEFDSLTPQTKLAWANHWISWVFSQEWWRKELFNPGTPEQVVGDFAKSHSDLQIKDMLSLSRTWQSHNVGESRGFNGDVEKALQSIKAHVLYMIGETDLYFPLKDAQYEAQFISNITFSPIPSIWGHASGAGINKEDNQFLNEQIKKILEK